MAAELLTDASRATDSNSNPYAGAQWRFYATGTLTPQNVYANADLSTSLGAVVTADAGGKFVPIYFDAALTYRGILKSADGATTIYDIDPINTGVMSQLSNPEGSSVVGFIQEEAGALSRTVEDKLREVLSVKDFGAKGDGVADDFAAIEVAIGAASSGSRGLHFPDGTYAFSGTLDFTHYNLKITFGTFAVLKHTGTGKAIQIDSGTYDEDDPPAVYGVQFGWGCPPTIQGNANTTDGLYVRGAQHLKIDVRLRDCATGLRCDFSVMSHFRIRFTSNEGGWEVLNPTNGVIVDKRGLPEATTDCQFDLIVEGMSGLGVDLISAQHCDFRGTSEGNGGGGVRIMSGSANNNFSNFFCEQNGAGHHWDIRGVGNIFLNCTGGGPSNTGANTNSIANTGIRNLFLRGKFHEVTEIGFFNEWRQTQLTGTPDMNANRMMEKCYDENFVALADNYPDEQFTTFTLAGLWTGQTASGQRPHGYYKDRSGTVHFGGAVKSGTGVIYQMPVGFRPAGTVYRPYYNVTAGATGVIAITSDGNLQHISGDTGTVDLSEMSYKAEG